MYKIRTSYFALYRSREGGVSIALKTPDRFPGEIITELQPTWEILSSYKSSNDPNKELIFKNRYIDNVLSKLDAREIAEKLNNKVLLCWEKSSSFCHRHIVTEWLEDNLGKEIDIREWEKKDEQ